jgi:hypothetical protein
MPYGFNPDYYDNAPGPFTSFASGVRAGTGLQESILRQQVQREALQRSQEEKEALKRYSLSQNIQDLYPVMKPEAAALMPFRLDEAQLANADKMVDYYNKAKWNLDLNTYPAFREDIFSRFPRANKSLFPPPEAFDGDPEKFDRWRGLAEQMASYFKRISSPQESKLIPLHEGVDLYDPVEKKVVASGPPKEPKGADWFRLSDGSWAWIVPPGRGQAGTPPPPPGATPKGAVGPAKSIWGRMADAAQVGDWDQFDFFNNLWKQQHPGQRPTLFKDDKTGRYEWLTPRPGEQTREGLHPVSEDMFKSLLGSQMASLIPPVPEIAGSKPPAPSGKGETTSKFSPSGIPVGKMKRLSDGTTVGNFGDGLWVVDQAGKKVRRYE